MKYINEEIVIVNEEKDGEDESPKKADVLEIDTNDLRPRE